MRQRFKLLLKLYFYCIPYRTIRVIVHYYLFSPPHFSAYPRYFLIFELTGCDIIIQLVLLYHSLPSTHFPFHHAIDSAIKASHQWWLAHQYGKSKETEALLRMNDTSLFSVINVLRSMMRINPEAREKKDGWMDGWMDERECTHLCRHVQLRQKAYLVMMAGRRVTKWHCH